ncbi:uncharacterized protein LOC112127324 isoform X3 [Cimex lectularius]|nr:uncharacterized protein LOC112127324 isoform X3 [Cimex lectularius]
MSKCALYGIVVILVFLSSMDLFVGRVVAFHQLQSYVAEGYLGIRKSADDLMEGPMKSTRRCFPSCGFLHPHLHPASMLHPRRHLFCVEWGGGENWKIICPGDVDVGAEPVGCCDVTCGTARAPSKPWDVFLLYSTRPMSLQFFPHWPYSCSFDGAAMEGMRANCYGVVVASVRMGWPSKKARMWPPTTTMCTILLPS